MLAYHCVDSRYSLRWENVWLNFDLNFVVGLAFRKTWLQSNTRVQTTAAFPESPMADLWKPKHSPTNCWKEDLGVAYLVGYTAKETFSHLNWGHAKTWRRKTFYFSKCLRKADNIFWLVRFCVKHLLVVPLTQKNVHKFPELHAPFLFHHAFQRDYKLQCSRRDTHNHTCISGKRGPNVLKMHAFPGESFPLLVGGTCLLASCSFGFPLQGFSHRG